MKKRKVLLTAILSIVMCASIITGSTYALFTSESEVNIAVSSAKVDVKASVAGATLYTPTSIDMDTYAAVYGSGKELALPEDGSLALDNLAPGDKVVVNLKLESASTVNYLYRVSLAQNSGDKDFYDNLLVGIDGAYYSEFVSEWKSGSSMDLEAEVEITVPAYLSNEFQNKSCELAFKVEAVQGNASVTNDTSKRVYPVYSQEELDAVLSEDLDENATIVLMQKWDNVSFETESALCLNVKGCNLDDVTVEALNSSINYFVNFTEMLYLKAIASNSFHLYGNVNMLELNHGRVVVEEAAIVEKATIAPNASQTALLKIVENAVTKEIKAINTGSVKIENDGLVEAFNAVENDNVEVSGSGEIGSLVGEVKFVTYVSTWDELKEAVEKGGNIVLVADIESTQTLSINKEVDLDLNGKTLIQNVTSTACIVLTGGTLNVSNGNYIIHQTASFSSADAVTVYGTLNLSNIVLEENLISTRTSSSQSFSSLKGNTNSAIHLINTSIVGRVESQQNENCKITIYGIYSSSNVTVTGGSITADYGVYFGSKSGLAILEDVNLNYTKFGIHMYYGGSTVIKSGVTFSGELSNPAIVVNYQKNAQLDDTASGYEWEYIKIVADCSSYEPVMERYQSGNVIKDVYKNEYAEHTYGEYEYDEWFTGYLPKCVVCGAQDYSNSISAGTSEEFYYPVKDEYSLQNASLNATNYIKLENDITIASSYYYQLMNGCVLDLNGHTITVNGNVYFNLEGSNVTIKGGSIARPSNADYSYGLKIGGGNVTVDGITIDSGINVSGGATATVKNCQITLNGAQAYYNVCAQVNAKVTIENCTLIKTTAGKANNYFWVEKGSSMSVSGCTFESTCGTTYYNKGGVAPTFDFVIEE